MDKQAKEKNKNMINNTKKKKKHIALKVFLVILLILLIAVAIFMVKVQQNGGGITGILKTSLGHDNDTVNRLDKLYCLILGQSQNLTDTIILASYDPKTQEAAMLSIPRDTFVGQNKDYAGGMDKINAIYQTGVENLLQDVREITGIDVRYYLKVDTEALKVLVDEIGGVYFDVPIDMDYDDSSQDLYIHLDAGPQLLNGQQAEWVVRFRHNNDGTTYPEEYGDNDLGRMRTQREFMMAVLKQTAKVENIFKLGEILDVAEQNVTTNINFDVAKDYIPYIVEFNTENLLTATLPGTTPPWDETNGVSIFVADENETEKMVQELFYDRDLEQEQTEGTSEDGNTVDTNTVSKADVTIEVLNGSGNSEKLNQAIKELEGAGYEVTRKGVTNSTSKTTIINKQNVADTILTNLEQVLGIGEISDGTSSSSKVDITIVLGKDYV